MPPPPSFDHFINAFSAPGTVSRVKRARTEALSPIPSPSKRHSLGLSPSNNREQSAAQSSPHAEAAEEVDEEVSSVQWFPEPDANGPIALEEVDHKAEVCFPPTLRSVFQLNMEQLLYHLFNHIPVSPLQHALDPQLVLQPTIYRILNYRPPPNLDSVGSYARACGDLLRASGSAELSYDGLLAVLAQTGSSLLHTLVPALGEAKSTTPLEEGLRLRNVSTLMTMNRSRRSSMCSLYFQPPHGYSIASSRHSPIFEYRSENISNSSRTESLQIRLVSSFGGMHMILIGCRNSPNAWRIWWKGFAGLVTTNTGASRQKWDIRFSLKNTCRICRKEDELVDIILSLTSMHLDVCIVRRGLEVAWSASCCTYQLDLKMETKLTPLAGKSNFRAVLALSSRSSGEQPVMERLGRYLIHPHSSASVDEVSPSSAFVQKNIYLYAR